MKAHSIISTLVAVAALVGCNQASRGKDKTKAASATSCADYAAKVCKETGEQSGACGTIKSASDLLAPEACATALTKVDFTLKKVAEQGAKCNELGTKLCADVGETSSACEMVKAQVTRFPPEKCVELLGNYTDVLAGLKAQVKAEEERNKPLDADKAAKIAQGAAPAFGPANATVTIVEFSDFQCPYCSKAAEATHKVKEKYGDKVRFVFRQFPLSFHKDAHQAAEASLAANAQGKFWEFHDKLFANQQKLDRASLEGYAKEVGLNVDKFKKSLDSKEFVATVDSEMKLGEEAAVNGTPSMFLNGARIANPSDFDAISKAIEEALKKGG